MNLRWSARVALLLLFVFAASTRAGAQTAPADLKDVQLPSGAFSLADPVPPWVDPVAMPPASNAAAIVFRLADTQWLVGSTPVLHVHRAVTVNDTASLTGAGQLPIKFVPQYQKLQLHAVRVLRGDTVLDRTASSSIRFQQRDTGVEQGVYSDEVTVSVLINDLRVGDTLDYAYSLHGTNPVFAGRFSEAAGWDQANPTSLRRVIVNAPVDRHISWRFIGDRAAKSIAPEETTKDGMRKLRFEEQSIAEVIAEPLTPPDHTTHRWLQLSEFSGWDDVVGWANGLFQPAEALDADLLDIVAKLRARATSEERVVAALEFVQSEIRYFSLAFGESSHRPTQPNITLRRRYGDCKDKTLLLITLLKELGIPSHPVLVSLGRGKGLDRLLPSPAVFDHAIVQATVDGHVYYLDPTRLGQHGRLDRMGQAHEGAQVLPIVPGGSRLTTIASANATDLARSERTEQAVISKFGADGRLTTRQVWYGVAAENIRVGRERRSREQMVKSIGDSMESRYPGSRLVGEPDLQDDRINNAFTITATYDVPKLAAEKDGDWFVRFTPSPLSGALVASPSSARSAPLVVPRFPDQAKYTIEVTFPEEVSVVFDPRSASVESKYFTYTISVAFRGNIAKTTIELTTLADRIAVPDLPGYADDLDKIGKIGGYVIAVPKTQIKSAAASEIKDFAATLRDRIQSEVDKVTETIKSGKLTGLDLAEAHCDRGVNFTFLGRVDEALRDAGESIKLAPGSKELLACRAGVYFNIGEFERSVADYSKAIRLGATGARMFYLRGISNYFAGRLEIAADDFAKASEAGDRESQVYSDLWLTWTARRLGRPIPEPVARRAAAQARGDWPRPALAVLTGNMTPDEMLKTLDSKSGDERHMALSEGYFYLGQHLLLFGDESKARELFEKTRQLQVVLYLEHMAAGYELHRLNGAAVAGSK